LADDQPEDAAFSNQMTLPKHNSYDQQQPASSGENPCDGSLFNDFFIYFFILSSSSRSCRGLCVIKLRMMMMMMMMVPSDDDDDDDPLPSPFSASPSWENAEGGLRERGREQEAICGPLEVLLCDQGCPHSHSAGAASTVSVCEWTATVIVATGPRRPVSYRLKGVKPPQTIISLGQLEKGNIQGVIM
jgi:hypothetical protein